MQDTTDIRGLITALRQYQEHQAGELLAAQAVLRGLLKHQPDAAGAAHAQLEQLTALSLARPVSDALLQGLHVGRLALLPCS